MTTTGEHSALFCPQCDYNLSGLTESRCPECGEPFDLRELRELAAKAPKPISAFAVVVHLLWPPVVFAALAFLVAVTSQEWLYGTLILVIGIYALVNSVQIAERTSITLSLKAGGSPYTRGNRGRVLVYTILLTMFQWVVNFVGCGTGAEIGHSINVR